MGGRVFAAYESIGDPFPDPLHVGVSGRARCATSLDAMGTELHVGSARHDGEVDVSIGHRALLSLAARVGRDFRAS